MSENAICQGCGEKFTSRNKMFKHLIKTDGACLNGQDYIDFCKYVRPKKQSKFLVLYGYIPYKEVIKNGRDAAEILVRVISQLENPEIASEGKTDEALQKFSRSYGHDQRGTEIVAQDERTSAITEVVALRMKALKNESPSVVDDWLDQVQQILDQQFDSFPVPIRVLGRQPMNNAKFNAEMDVTNRRVDYLLPGDFLSWSNKHVKSLMKLTPSFRENHKNVIASERKVEDRPQEEVRIYMLKLKKIMQKFSTQVVQLDVNDKSAVLEKGFSLQKRQGQSKKSNRKRKKKFDQNEASEEERKDKVTNELVKNAGKHGILKRKRFHNFTSTVMAHEYLSYRRLDRMYHRATLRFSTLDPTGRPYLLLSITGDMFLTGQVLRIVGLFLGVANGLVPPDFIDCVFDENYPHLIPTPPALPIGMMASEAHYMTWEGKVQAILSPRATDRYSNGWNKESTLLRVKDWQEVVNEELTKKWLARGCDKESGRLVEEIQWTEKVLKPWAHGARKHLEAYRQWLQSKNTSNTIKEDSKESLSTSVLPSLSLEDSTVPDLFQKVLYHLREIDKNGQWPSTTLKRQLVMVSTAKTENDEAKVESLSIAHMKAKNNKQSRSSAYGFTEGQGGASGSFSVGYFPGDSKKQPKSNLLFPELVKAAFELETKLMPDRASSTIAINRNAQFRPHTDSGAGAGQSTSLIVGLGTYSGGELMVEGEKCDIRYKAVEFNGWTQRHWTMPFSGERYSLVWFTPKGCEGMRGIDLKL